MSAYIVSKAHIDALVAVAANGPANRSPKYPGDGWTPPMWRLTDNSQDALNARHNPDLIGSMLWQENVMSVVHRYPNSLNDLPGPVDFDAEMVLTYTSERPARMLTATEALKAIDGYEYQSCEHPEWKDSQARAFCDALRRRLISTLPGYDEAAWEID